MKRLASAAAILGLAAIGIPAMPASANAWWRGPGVGIGIFVPPIYVAPPPYYGPPPYYAPPPVAYYAPPPGYSYGPPHRYWVPDHWERGYWVRGHWR